ncbi:MAG: phosphocarrier protein HPr [Gammaproteobacteria bacterium]|nr:MAG: phosphocarrier protein HPr [Gammaproteobacteria bacterium]
MRREATSIINKLGLHARAAAKLVATATAYDCAVNLEINAKQSDAKSIMALLMLAAGQGTELHIVTDGSDENEAMEAVLNLINDRFEEDQ